MTALSRASGWRKNWMLLAMFGVLSLIATACGVEDDVAVDEVDDDIVDEPADEPEEEPEVDEDVDEPAEPADDAIVIGHVNALEGPFAAGAEDGSRAVELALQEFDSEINGRPIEVIVESSDTTPDTAVERARKLVEQDGVDIVYGPLSGSEGVAISQYAAGVPDVTFVDASSGGAETTLEGPDNYFRFTAAGDQQGGNFGTYAYEELGIERVAIVAEDYAFPHALAGSFITQFCEAGGEVTEAFWVPLGESDYSSVIASMPTDVDAIYGGIGGSDAVNFLQQSIEFGLEIPLIGGSILVDETVLAAEGADLRDAVEDIVAAAPVFADEDNAEWVDFEERYHAEFPDGFETPSLFAALYYNSFKSLLHALEEVGGDLDDGHEGLRNALSTVAWDTPIGPIDGVDENNQGAVSNFIFQVVEGDDGELTTELLRRDDGIEQHPEPFERLDGCP